MKIRIFLWLLQVTFSSAGICDSCASTGFTREPGVYVKGGPLLTGHWGHFTRASSFEDCLGQCKRSVCLGANYYVNGYDRRCYRRSHVNSVGSSVLSVRHDTSLRSCGEVPECGGKVWSDWGNWSSCDKECGGGSQRKTRSCQPAGASCPGAATSDQVCNTADCPVWNDWSQWGSCSEICDGGISIRNRTCSISGLCGQANTMQQATPDMRGETQTCNTEDCGPCPNTDCWDFDEPSQKCTLKDVECAQLECTATEMKISLAPGVFGGVASEVATAVKDLDLTQTNVTIHQKSFEDGFEKICALGGNCSMTHEIVNKTLLFTFDMSPHNNPEMLTLTNSMSLQMSQSTAGDLSFRCAYGLNINVMSSEFFVQDVQISGTQHSVGKLDDAFTLILDSSSVILGDIMKAQISWNIKTLTDVGFYVERCEIKQDNHDVFLFKDGCLSSTLLEDGSYSANATDISFGYKTFKVNGAAAGSKQILSCFLNIFMNNSSQPINDNQCQQNTAYKFTVNGL